MTLISFFVLQIHKIMFLKIKSTYFCYSNKETINEQILIRRNQNDTSKNEKT